MEAIGYLLIYFLKGGRLPWMGYREENMRERFKKIGLSKQHLNITGLCRDIPREMAVYLRYVRALRFTETPDYNYLRSEHFQSILLEPLVTGRSLMRSSLISRDQVEDDVFDWMTLTTFCSSPYLDHPPKAAKVLGTLGSRSHREELCPQEETRRSRSWNIESSAGVSAGDLSSPLVSQMDSSSGSGMCSTEKETRATYSVSQSTVILRTEAASHAVTPRPPSQSSREADQEQEQVTLEEGIIQPVSCSSCFSFIHKFKIKF